MGSPHPLIVRVTAPEYKKLIVETSDGTRYYSDLSPLESVYCFPKNQSEWRLVSVDGFASALIWVSRFEAHVDQIIGLAYKKESLPQSA